MDRYPVLRSDPTLPAAARGRAALTLSAATPPAGTGTGTGWGPGLAPHPDRLEVVRTRSSPRAADRRPRGRRPRHRRPLGPRPPVRPGAGPLLLGVAAVGTLLLVLGVPLPAPLAALALLTAVTVLGLPVLHLLRVPVPDPVGRVVLAAASGLVLVTGLFRLADGAGWRPGGPAVAVAGLALLVLAVVGRGALAPPGAPPPRPTRALRAALPRLPLLALPALAWVDALGDVPSPGWLRAAVLAAAVALLARLTLRRRPRTDRVGVAATVHAVAVAVLTPLGGAASGAAATPWGSGLARAWSLTPGTVEAVVLPAVTALVVVGTWLVAERVVGTRRAVVVAVLALAALAAAPPGPGDLAVTAAVLLVVTRSPAGRPGPAATGRRLLVLLLGAGALLTAPSAAVFGAQVCLAALAGTVLGPAGRRPGRVLTLPLALGFAVAVWGAAALGQRLPVTGGAVPAAGVVLVALAAAGLLAVLLRRVPRPPTDTEFLALAAAGLLVQAVAAAGAGSTGGAGSPVPHVLLLLTVPAVLGVGVVWGVLSAGLGLVLDRVPARWLRSDSRATRAHRGTPGRALRTALVALALFALAYARRAFG
ncbi:hypothetical protein AB1207_08245 [Kineococcus endophyticus]|uniref:Uncharacterized protein n=1 Tax=Kineococcus endophyticus TaxID=1181883 RepID=A0ABV3P537_9ACTN